MAFPATPLDVEVSLYLSGAWVDYTSYVREDSKVAITRGRRSRAGQVVASTCAFTLDNTDGRFCRLNPTSTLFGQIDKGTPVRVRINNGSGYVSRGVFYVTGWPPDWDPSERDQTVKVTAVGILDRLGRGEVVRSPVWRSAATVDPLTYLPMEDGAVSTVFASGLTGGTSAVTAGGPAMASVSAPAGSADVAGFGPTATFNPVQITGAAAGYVQISFVYRGLMATSPSTVSWLPCRVVLAGGTVAGIGVEAFAEYTGGAFTSTVGIGVVGGIDSTSHGDNPWDGEAHTCTITATQNGADIDYGLWVDGTLAASGTSAGQTLGVPVSLIGPTATSATVSGVDNTGAVWGMGHLLIQDVADLSPADYHSAATGRVGEQAHDRGTRMCAEEGVTYSTTATTSTPMGAQLRATLIANLRDLQNTDQGILVEALAGGISYLASSERANPTAAITLAYNLGDILPPWRPNDDNQDFFNEITAQRPGGAPHRLADSDSIAAVGLRDDSTRPNTETESGAVEVGGWQLHLGLNDELTWPAVRLGMYHSSTLRDAWLASDIGDQMWVTGHPSPLAPDTIMTVIEGYTETFGSYLFDVVAVTSPGSPYVVGALDDDLSSMDTAGCELVTAETSASTSWLIHTIDGPEWDADAAERVEAWMVAGEKVTVSAIAATTPTFVAAGTAAHADNASVTPGLPAGIAAGDLLLVWAAIRNSGTGTVDTPTGYTALLTSGNVGLYATYATGSDVAPTVSATGGVVGATMSAQMAAFTNLGRTVHASAVQLNSSAQNIAYPDLSIERDACVVLYLGWKQDDWTSVASPGTEIAEPDTTTGDDQGLVWAYTIQTTATSITGDSFTVTGGAAAISRGAVVALASDVQTATVVRAANTVAKAQVVGARIVAADPLILTL